MKKRMKSGILAFLVLFGMAVCAGAAGRPVTTSAAAGIETADAVEKETAESPEEIPEKTVQIGVLVWKFSDPYGTSVREAMEQHARTAEKELGVRIELDMQDADGDPAVQKEQAERMFASDKDLIIINLADIADGQYMDELALSSGIPVLFYNREPLDADIIRDVGSVYIGTDAAEAGILQAEIFDSLFRADADGIDRNGDGKISYLMFEGESDNPEAIARTEYCIRTLMEMRYSLEALAETQVANWDREEAKGRMSALLQDLDAESIEAVFCNNDAMAVGVVEALEEAGWNLPDDDGQSDRHICVLGVDATEEGFACIRTGQIDGTVLQDAVAMGTAILTIALHKVLTGDYLKGTDYALSDDLYSVRMPYTPVTQKLLTQR